MVLLAVLGLLFLVDCSNSSMTSKFLKGSICGVNERIDHGYSKHVSGVHGIFECLAQCGRKNDCVGASLDDTGKCFHHELSTSIEQCTAEDTSHKYWASYCVHGSWNAWTGSCTCIWGTSGNRCENYSKKCEGLLNGRYTNGDYRIPTDPYQNGKLIFVNCNIKTSSSSIQIMRKDGNTNFNRTWMEFVDGFSSNENFWLGLKHWRSLTLMGCPSTQFSLHFDGVTKTRQYNYFQLLDEVNYAMAYTFLHTSSASGATYLKDCIIHIDHTPFSTWDKDNDVDVNENCASKKGTGGWYPGPGCDVACNMFGRWNDTMDAIPIPQRFHWHDIDMPVVASQLNYVEIRVLC